MPTGWTEHMSGLEPSGLPPSNLAWNILCAMEIQSCTNEGFTAWGLKFNIEATMWNFKNHLLRAFKYVPMNVPEWVASSPKDQNLIDNSLKFFTRQDIY